MSETPPNVILVVCDQLRADGVGCDGNPLVQTPNLDALAARGTRFAHACSAVSSRLPARANLWSGQNQWHTNARGQT